MKKRNILFVVWVGAVIFYASSAFAETIRGMVTYIDPVNQLMAVRETNVAGTVNQRMLAFGDGVRIENVETVENVTPGQLVSVEARKEPSKQILEAQTIRVTGDALKTTASIGRSA